jgi:hypothetical protein
MSDAAEIPTRKMTSKEFMEWYARQPDGERYELIEGVIVPRFSKDIPWEMQADRVVHGG